MYANAFMYIVASLLTGFVYAGIVLLSGSILFASFVMFVVFTSYGLYTHKYCKKD